jgi:hypothetical protein
MRADVEFLVGRRTGLGSREVRRARPSLATNTVAVAVGRRCPRGATSVPVSPSGCLTGARVGPVWRERRVAGERAFPVTRFVCAAGGWGARAARGGGPEGGCDVPTPRSHLFCDAGVGSAVRSRCPVDERRGPTASWACPQRCIVDSAVRWRCPAGKRGVPAPRPRLSHGEGVGSAVRWRCHAGERGVPAPRPRLPCGEGVGSAVRWRCHEGERRGPNARGACTQSSIVSSAARVTPMLRLEGSGVAS